MPDDEEYVLDLCEARANAAALMLRGLMSIELLAGLSLALPLIFN